MKQEYGRSLIEIIGVLAIGTILSVAAISTYRSIRTTQVRTIATAELEKIVKDVKLLAGARGTYDGISVEYLVKAGSIKSVAAPIGGDNWSITPSFDGTSFSINLSELSSGECAYFTTKQPTWADAILVNGHETDGASHCFSTNTNMIAFIIK